MDCTEHALEYLQVVKGVIANTSQAAERYLTTCGAAIEDQDVAVMTEDVIALWSTHDAFHFVS